jgi:hypothetical protein
LFLCGSGNATSLLIRGIYDPALNKAFHADGTRGNINDYVVFAINSDDYFYGPDDHPTHYNIRKDEGIYFGSVGRDTRIIIKKRDRRDVYQMEIYIHLEFDYCNRVSVEIPFKHGVFALSDSGTVLKKPCDHKNESWQDISISLKPIYKKAYINDDDKREQGVKLALEHFAKTIPDSLEMPPIAFGSLNAVEEYLDKRAKKILEELDDFSNRYHNELMKDAPNIPEKDRKKMSALEEELTSYSKTVTGYRLSCMYGVYAPDSRFGKYYGENPEQCILFDAGMHLVKTENGFCFY